MSKVSPFQLKKSVHINLTTSTHSDFRIMLFKKGLSMQEVFESLAVKITEGDEYLNNLLLEMEYNKKNKSLNKKIGKSDAESIFEAIEFNNPLDGEDV